MKLIIQNSAKVWGGNEKWLATLAAGLQARGHSVVVSCKKGLVRERLRALGIATSGVRPRGAADFVSALAFAIWLRRQRADAVLLTSWQPTAWAAWAAHRARVPRLIVRLGIVRAAPKRGMRARAFARWVDALIVNSSEIKTVWIESAPAFGAEHVHVVMNGIQERTREHAELRNRLRSELRAGADTFVLAGAGHLHRRKGFDVLLRAFAAAALSDALLIIVGDGPERASLQQLAQQLGIAEAVRFLGQRDDGPDVVAGSDAFALCSRNEGMANVMLEAMAAGVPVVATAISGVQRALAAEGGGPPAGWIVPADDPAALASTLQEIATASREKSALLAQRTGEAARRIRQDFSIARMVEECEAILFGGR
jgi:glycosyltransferase involved in cell wall biosynthesis